MGDSVSKTEHPEHPEYKNGARRVQKCTKVADE